MPPVFNPCVVIPVFNHHHNIAAVVHTIIQQGVPVLLVDDGSSSECASVLENLSVTSGVKLHRLNQNQGKGVAVCTGLALAHAAGFSHALQIDADGQHDLSDVPAFLAAGKANPASVICGARDYLAMPASRRSGRRLTDVWVHINTLSRQIKDSMCGYRLYPLNETIALLSRYRVGRRMDFDTDILVRLYWSGLSVHNITTEIRYHTDVPSHFDVWADNLRISWMHTRLFFGMLPRIPRLLLRHFS